MMRDGGYRPEGSDISGAEPVNSAVIVLVVKKCLKNTQFYISRSKMKTTERLCWYMTIIIIINYTTPVV